MKKKLLLVLLGISIVFAVLAICANMQVRATPDERARTLAGDDLIPQPIGSVNHAITIRRPPHHVWPWLAQMGSDRAGWYAYDFIDNGGHRSAEQILPAYQDIRVGSVLPALPGAKDVFVVAQCEPEHSLILSWRLPSGQYQTTWAFVLEQPQPDQTRLIVRGRVASGYRPYGLPEWLAMRVGRLAHFIMQRKQLLGIARRAEAYDRHVETVAGRDIMENRLSRWGVGPRMLLLALAYAVVAGTATHMWPATCVGCGRFRTPPS